MRDNKDSTPIDPPVPTDVILVREHSGQWVETDATYWKIDEGALMLYRVLDSKTGTGEWIGTWPPGGWSGVKPRSMRWTQVSSSQVLTPNDIPPTPTRGYS